MPKLKAFDLHEASLLGLEKASLSELFEGILCSVGTSAGNEQALMNLNTRCSCGLPVFSVFFSGGQRQKVGQAGGKDGSES